LAKLVVHELGKTFRPTGKWSWLAGLQDDAADEETDGVFTKAWQKREITAFSNVSFALDEGEALGIVGPPVSGKTSLLRVIAGLTAPTTGSVTGQGSVVYMNGLRQAPYPKLSLRANLEAVTEFAVGRRVDRGTRDAAIKRAADLLDMHSRLDTAP
jgi:ABC-type polysaccharide/polyol phosphate transport system ATPase subunit